MSILAHGANCRIDHEGFTDGEGEVNSQMKADHLKVSLLYVKNVPYFMIIKV